MFSGTHKFKSLHEKMTMQMLSIRSERLGLEQSEEIVIPDSVSCATKLKYGSITYEGSSQPSLTTTIHSSYSTVVNMTRRVEDGGASGIEYEGYAVCLLQLSSGNISLALVAVVDVRTQIRFHC